MISNGPGYLVLFVFLEKWLIILPENTFLFVEVMWMARRNMVPTISLCSPWNPFSYWPNPSVTHPQPTATTTLWCAPCSASRCVSPAGCVHGLLVGGWDGETHRGDHGLVPRRTDHLPLGPLGVVFQHTLLSPGYCDLRGGRGSGWTETGKREG